MDIAFFESLRERASAKYTELEASKARTIEEMARLQGEYRVLGELIDKTNQEEQDGTKPRGKKPASKSKTAPRRAGAQPAQ